MLALIRSTAAKAGLKLQRVEFVDKATNEKKTRLVLVTDPEINPKDVKLVPVGGKPLPEIKLPEDWKPI